MNLLEHVGSGDSLISPWFSLVDLPVAATTGIRRELLFVLATSSLDLDERDTVFA